MSEYEKIRAANIKEQRELLQKLQGDWQGFKESEGLVAAVKIREKGAKKFKREAKKSPAASCTSNDISDQLIEENERHLEAMRVLNRELKVFETKEEHANNLQDMSKQVRIYCLRQIR